MTTIPADLACRHLASLWPAPARFTVVAPGGGAEAGDADLAGRVAGLLADLPADARVIRDGDVIVVRGAGGAALAADVPAVALPGLLEADLLRLTSAPA
jgi:hypothetical protein